MLKDLELNGSAMADYDSTRLALNRYSVTSYFIFSSIKKRPINGISTSPLRYSSLRVAFFGSNIGCRPKTISFVWISSARQGRYIERKLAVNHRNVPINTPTNIFIITVLKYRLQTKSGTAKQATPLKPLIKSQADKKRSICYHLMYRKKDYNAVGWEDGQPTASVETNRRLNHGISRNIALLNRSNNSNHSNSIRLKRTENSNDRINLSKERDLNTPQNSGLPTQSYNQSTRRVPRSIGSVLSLNRKRLLPQTHRIPAASSRTGRNIVENLYMLTNNTPKYADRNVRSGKSPQMNPARYSPLDRYQKQQRYERIAERRPQAIPQRRPQRYPQASPRRYPESRQQRYPQPRPQHYQQPRQNRYPETKNEQYVQRNANRYPERGGHRYPQRNPERYPENNQKYKDRYNQQQKYETRTPTPNRGSVLRSRKDKSGLRRQRTDLSRDKSFRQNGGSRDGNRRPPDNQMRKLQEKYMQNLYELNGPDDRGRRVERDKFLNEPAYRQAANRVRPDKYSNNRQNQMREKYRSRDFYDKNKPYRQPSDHAEIPYADKDNRHKQQYRESRNAHRYRGQREYREQEGQYRDERGVYQSDGNQQEWFDQRGGSKDSRGYYQQDPYGGRGQRGQRGKNQVELKRRNDKLKPIYSGKNTTGYSYPEQVPSTTAGIRTLPEISRYDTISDASTPLNSFGSHKQFAKNTIASQVPQKPSVKLDRKAVRPQRHKRKQYQQSSQQSSMEARWQKNNIHLQQREIDRWDVKNKKAIDQGVEPGSLPTGSVFLPVESRRIQKNEWADDILERIILHLETLNLIADYTKEFKKMYENVQPWEILIFLTYKKFYIERMKVVNILKPTTQKNNAELEIKQNPFTLPYSKISEKQISKFTTTRECFALMIQLQTQNSRIRNALRGLYNLYIQKSGEHVNMLDCDNFSELIYRLMIEECDGIAENLQDAELVLPTRLRMGKIIKVGLLIAFLNGKYIKNFAQIIIHEDIIKVGKRETLRQDNISQQFLTQFKRVLS